MSEWWVKEVYPNEFAVGLTTEAIKQFGCIWQWIPRVQNGDTIFKGQGLATIQTMMALKSLTSPIAGTVTKVFYTDRANCLTDKHQLFVVRRNALSGM